MKLKVSEWGNSHGIRLSSAMLEHLNVQAGDELDIAVTERGVEIIKNNQGIDYLSAVQQEVLDAIIAGSEPVKQVEDPYKQTEVAYTLVAIDPCAPLIREVPAGTAGSYPTLSDAKEAARQAIQSAVTKAQKSMSDLRQLGIPEIGYISL